MAVVGVTSPNEAAWRGRTRRNWNCGGGLAFSALGPGAACSRQRLHQGVRAPTSVRCAASLSRSASESQPGAARACCQGPPGPWSACCRRQVAVAGLSASHDPQKAARTKAALGQSGRFWGRLCGRVPGVTVSVLKVPGGRRERRRSRREKSQQACHARAVVILNPPQLGRERLIPADRLELGGPHLWNLLHVSG